MPKFQSHDEVAEQYIYAGGKNRDEGTIRSFFIESTDAEMAEECEYQWGLDQLDDEGNPRMPDYDAEKLKNAFAKLRKNIMNRPILGDDD
jgi:hypothetical protein